MKQRPRRREFVDPQVQGELARRLSLHWLLFTVVAAAIAVCLEWAHDPFRPLSAVFQEACWNYSPLLLALWCLVPVFIYDAIKLSNRFAGPVSRLRKVAAALAQGELPEHVELRGNDFWRDLAADFNRIIDRIACAEADADTVREDSDFWLVDGSDHLHDEPAAVAGRIDAE